MRKQIQPCILLFFLLPVLLTAENLIFNGGFELGNAGFQCIKYLRPDTNAKLTYEGAFADSKERMAGDFSLCIPNRFSETVFLMTPEFQLRPDTEYTFSIWMKAERENYPVELSILSASVYERWDVKHKTFSVCKSWKRYSLTFQTSGKRKSPWYVIGLKSCHEIKGKGATLWLDNIQLGQGKNTDWHPGSPVEIALLPEQDYFVGEEGRANCAIRLAAVNYTGEKQEIPLELSIRRERRGNSPEPVDKENIERFPLGKISLNPGVNELPVFRYPAKRFGAYCIQSLVNSIPGEYKGYFAVIGRYDSRPIDLNRDFCVSVNLGAGNIVVPPRWGETLKRGFRAAGGGPDKLFSTLAAMGCRLIRDWGYPQSSCHWRLLEPEEGKFDFSVMDWAYEISGKYGMILLPVLGASDTHNPIDGNVGKGTLSGLPAWLLKKSRKIPSPAWLTAGGKAWFIPPEEFWRKMIRATAVHFNGRIRWFEIMNEPNICMDASSYLRFLEIAREEIRKNAPGTKIVGVCSTGDLGGNLTTFVGKVLSGGGLDNLDVLSFHPYDAPNLGSPIPADQQIKDLHSLIQKYGRHNVPIWNTELYYMRVGGKNWFEQAVVFPEDVAKRFLTDLGEGVAQSIPLQFGEMFKSSTPHISTSMYGNNQFIPNSNFVVYNALARFFEGAKVKKKIRYPNGCICYIFHRNGKLIAAVWNYLGRSGVRTDFSGFEVMDLFGNKEEPGMKILKEAPYYLMQGKMNEKEFLDKIKNLKMILDDPVSVGEFGRLSGNILFVMLHNASEKSVAVSLGLNGKGLTAKEMVQLEIPAKGKMPAEIPVKIKDAGVKESILVIQLNGNIFRKKIKIIRNPMISGTFEGKNFKGTLNFFDEKIRVKVTVQDPTDAGPVGNRNVWEIDCVELFFDTDPLFIPERYAQAYTKNTFRIFVTPRDGKLTAQGIDPSVCKYSVKSGKDSYIVELSIPAKTGKYLGFECKIDDFDSEGKCVGETQIGNEKELHKKRCSFVFACDKTETILKRNSSVSFTLQPTSLWKKTADDFAKIEYDGRKAWSRLKIKPEKPLKPRTLYRITFAAKSSGSNTILGGFESVIQSKKQHLYTQFFPTADFRKYAVYFNSGEIPNGTPSIYFNPTSAFQMEVKDIKLEEMPEGSLSGKNLLQCGNFEDGNPFHPYMKEMKKHLKIVDYAEFMSGENSLLLVCQNKWIDVISGLLPVVPGKEIEVKFYAKSKNAAQVRLILDFGSGFGGKHYFLSVKFRLGKEWKEFSHKFKISEDFKTYPVLHRSFARLRFGGQAISAEGNAKIYLDGISYTIKK